MNDSKSDLTFMRMALALAEQGMGLVEPNPMVGCVIVRDSKVIGSGYHQKFGGPHAEVEALRSCPGDVKGAVAYVTLEPCCHHGKTAPCSDALIQAGIGRVVVAMEDPFAQVAGGGMAALRRAGIEVEVGVLKSESESLNAPYCKRIRTSTPWVIAKWAMTADGRIATSSGESQWITGESARRQVHQLRSRVDAIAVGMGTVDADNPHLTARPPGQRVATRVVFCRHRVPPVDARLIESIGEAPVLVVAASSLPASLPEPLQKRGCEVFRCASDDPVEMVQEALRHFGQRSMTNVMIEGGSDLLASFFEAGQIDECHVHLGGKVFGGKESPGPIGGVGVSGIADAMPLSLSSLDQFDDDIVAIYRKKQE